MRAAPPGEAARIFYSSNWIISPIRGENQESLKPPREALAGNDED